MPRVRQHLTRIRHPNVEILAPVARRGVHEAGAGIVRDVIAVEQRDVEIRSPEALSEWMTP